MKEIKQSMKRKRWLQFPKMIVVVLVVMLIAVFLSSCSNNQPALNVLKKKQFVLIKMGDPLYKDFEVGFDLREEEFYYIAETAVKDDTVYGGYKADWDRKQYYKSAVNNELSSVLLSKKITTDEIKKSNYQITSSPKRFLDDKLMKEEYPPEFEAIYLKKNRQFTKVRITYNKEFLPTRIEWYYKGEEGLKWYTWRTYSYPFKNKSYFDKKLDEEIKDIKEIQEENEGD
ncbi:hypothetical protein [Streptococcus sp. HMSC065E03]|uniref:hypothetical protein n=1 Tax=Streptococcus TaxID=1301 RepID=UPI000AACE409|nr:hypothetical protein [Streptococcus sp. HMSC065E03]MDU4887037.1 hypothetical protein [Streptococcus parasanguinis]